MTAEQVAAFTGFHQLNKAQLDTTGLDPGEEGIELVMVNITHQHGIHHYLVKAGGEGGVNAVHHLVELVLAGGGQSRQGAAMEGVVQGDDGATALAILVKGVFPGQLDHGLVALGPGVGEHHVGHTRTGAQLLGQLGVRLGVVQVGDVGQLGGLGGHRVHPGLIVIAQGAHADAGGEVDVLLPGHVPHGGPLAVVHGHGEAAVGGHHILLVQGFDLFKRHRNSPAFSVPAWCRCPRRTAAR